ncbi:MAG TPA: outer membrane beta-barrel protein [Ohtaekwangia sp.]|uniref:outer membrane beta-barrel protein n=1 Tax=Ohtaekwangia sp. TaxID=2066019 RepID=UPI002F93251B
MRRVVLYSLVLLGLASQGVLAQAPSLSGIVADSTDHTALIGVTVLLQQAGDTTRRTGTVTDVEGKFSFTGIKPGRYIVKLSYIGYAPCLVRVRITDAPVDLGNIALSLSSTTLKAVEIKGASIQVEQKGDTLQYNANAFKTNRDATAEDLITKMPGLTSDNTGVKAQGEAVQQILVDGKQFFGDDATLALKNLPAEIIDKIEVFDRLSEQSQFTGFDDGQTRKTVNIVTKKGKNNGQFGRVYGGMGENGLYIAGGNINSFKGNRKLSLVGLSNNINQQNFSTEDLLGVTSSSGSSQGGGGGGNRGQRGGGNGSSNNFSVGQQNGISTTHSVGLNYADVWSKKVNVTGSYFFNRADNEQITNLRRQYITQQDSGLVYNERSRANSVNSNHRFNLRLEYTIDTANSIVVTPQFNYQKNNAKSSLQGDYAAATHDLESSLANTNQSDNAGYTFSNAILYRHRFRKRGRSWSVSLNTNINNRDGSTNLYSLNKYQSPADSTIVDQQSSQYTDSYTLSTNIAYTEPVGKHGQVQLNYTPSYTSSKTDKHTYDRNADTNAYTHLDTLLTNVFDNRYITNRGGVSYRFNNRKLNFSSGVNYQYAKLTGDQYFPYTFAIDRAFQNVLPQATFNYRFKAGENLRIMYRTATDAPSVSQLQNVVDNRNPLFLKTGNPELVQDYSHNLTIRYGRTNNDKSSSLLFLVAGSLTQNYITNASYIASRDTVVQGIFLNRGTQLSYPVNINGYATMRTLLTYGLPVAFLKSNMNLSTGFTYNRMPAVINGARNLANNYGISQGLVLSSNVSEDVDFTLSYTANYTIVKNTLQKQSDNNYFNQTGSFKLTWLFWKGFVLTSTLNNTLYRGLSATYDQSIWFWNAGLGYKFLKDKSLEVKVTAFDIFNQNNVISRDVTQTYIEDRQTNVLTRYFMLTLTYSIRHFK